MAKCENSWNNLESAYQLAVKKYYNNFQEHNFLRDLNSPPFFRCYVATKKRAGLSNPLGKHLHFSAQYGTPNFVPLPSFFSR